MRRSCERTAILLVVAILAGCWTVEAQAPLPVPPQPPAPQGAPLPALPAPPVTVVPAAPPSFPAAELDRIVSPIALYPDPLLAQVLAAATYSDQIPPASQWADQHHYLSGPSLTAAMAADQVPWDPAVQALLPFPSVLVMMASALPWTEEVGSAFLIQHDGVMDAVQRMRLKASNYGYLRSNAQVVVRTGRYIEIVPVNPGYIVVPYYNPAVVFVPARRGLAVENVIYFGHGVTLGVAFAGWGWNTNRFAWAEHMVVINDAPWQRTWVNRETYIHPYQVPRYSGRRPADTHRPIERSLKEREDERSGRGHEEEHRP